MPFTSEMAAREIVRFAVHAQNVHAGELIPSAPVVARFKQSSEEFTQLMPGLVYAQERGWITQEGRLTQRGFNLAA